MARTAGAKNKPKAAAKKPPKKAPKPPKAAAAKKPGTKPVGPAAAEVGKAGQARRIITQNNLNRLLDKVERLKGESDQVVGSLRQEIADAVQHQFLNKEVFALIRRLKKKTPEKLLIFLEDFDTYLLHTGLEALADSVGKLPLDEPQAGGEGEDDSEDEGAGDAGDDQPELPAAASSATAGNAVEQDEVSRPTFSGKAPGGTVHMLPQVAGAKH